MTWVIIIAVYFCFYVWDAKHQRKNKYVRGKKYTYKK